MAMGRSRLRSVAGRGCIAVACALLLVGCGWTATVTVKPPPATTATIITRTSPAPPPHIDNASGTLRPWLASPVLAPALAVTPTPRVCPTPDPRNVAATATGVGGTCQQTHLFPAPAPTEVVAVAVDGAVEIQWLTVGGGGTHYVVYRQIYPHGEWVSLASVATDPDLESSGRIDRATPYAWRDTTASRGVTYRYTVAKVSAYGIRSNNSQATLPITAP